MVTIRLEPPALMNGRALPAKASSPPSPPCSSELPSPATSSARLPIKHPISSGRRRAMPRPRHRKMRIQRSTRLPNQKRPSLHRPRQRYCRYAARAGQSAWSEHFPMPTPNQPPLVNASRLPALHGTRHCAGFCRPSDDSCRRALSRLSDR